MLAASAIPGASQKLDACATLQNNLFAAERSFNFSHMSAQFGSLKEIAHLLKRLCCRFLEVRGVNNRFVEQEHPRYGPSLYQ